MRRFGFDLPENGDYYGYSLALIEQSRTEWFLKGTEVGKIKFHTDAATRQARITYPANGSVLALDPDIPVNRQVVFFESTQDEKKVIWRLNGVILVTQRGWMPVPGRHSLALLHVDGEVRDEVHFEVRGTSNRRLSGL